MWAKGKTLEDVVVIGEEEGWLYKLKGHSDTTLVHETTSSSELWHRRLAHINYKAFPYVRKVVTRLLDLEIKHEGTCKGCAQGKNIKNLFPKTDTNTKGTLELIHSNVCGPIPSISLGGYEYSVTLLMIIQERLGYNFWRIKVKCWGNSRNSKP